MTDEALDPAGAGKYSVGAWSWFGIAGAVVLGGIAGWNAALWWTGASAAHDNKTPPASTQPDGQERDALGGRIARATRDELERVEQAIVAARQEKAAIDAFLGAPGNRTTSSGQAGLSIPMSDVPRSLTDRDEAMRQTVLRLRELDRRSMALDAKYTPAHPAVRRARAEKQEAQTTLRTRLRAALSQAAGSLARLESERDRLNQELRGESARQALPAELAQNGPRTSAAGRAELVERGAASDIASDLASKQALTARDSETRPGGWAAWGAAAALVISLIVAYWRRRRATSEDDEVDAAQPALLGTVSHHSGGLLHS